MNAVRETLITMDDAAALFDVVARDERITFQTFGEGISKGRRELNRILHGTLAQHQQELASLNERGAGVFWMVNAGDWKGRKGSNVLRVRALFVDLDGAPLKPIRAGQLEPHCILESSPGRWHAYWLVSDCPLESFKYRQIALATRFGADLKVCDLPRVMRLPGFLHNKGTPFRSRVIDRHIAPPYTCADIDAWLGLDEARISAPIRKPALVVTSIVPTRQLADAICEGERNSTLFELARGLVKSGIPTTGVINRLQTINAERCQPPLRARDVAAIASRASGYGSAGFVNLPHNLLDSPVWLELPPTSCVIVEKFYRRYNGYNNGRLSVPWSDVKGQHGISSSRRFYQYLGRAVSAGVLIQTASTRNGQTGRVPAMYAIADQYLAQVSKQNLGQSVKATHLNR